ncbi:hypothetical protein PO587_43625 [Streptomyces gilvifuscus]|uniref:Cupin domain-containing protein n=1 Tax=Streptomyces gilvifuscus TaxID=1550617 RepID=A0ABT5G9I7_9ACTN|nr:hypothetical protein [Streptomyces gilvifuscus]MDC2961336.1 hypothetical protein [Streptomyces gilvifuscus]
MGNRHTTETAACDVAHDRPSDAEASQAHLNRQVGTRLLFQNSAVRVWEVHLEPGARAPLHCHALNYFWTCTASGTALQWQRNGSEWRRQRRSYAVGDTQFFAYTEASPVVHDLYNDGDTTLRFITVELLGTPQHTPTNITPGGAS